MPNITPCWLVFPLCCKWWLWSFGNIHQHPGSISLTQGVCISPALKLHELLALNALNAIHAHNALIALSACLVLHARKAYILQLYLNMNSWNMSLSSFTIPVLKAFIEVMFALQTYMHNWPQFPSLNMKSKELFIYVFSSVYLRKVGWTHFLFD